LFLGAASDFNVKRRHSRFLQCPLGFGSQKYGHIRHATAARRTGAQRAKNAIKIVCAPWE